MIAGGRALVLAAVLVACEAAHLPVGDAMQGDDASLSLDAGRDGRDGSDVAPIDASDAACDASTFFGPAPLRSCASTADCGTNGSICSHVCAGCTEQGVCIWPRMCNLPETLCGCDGTTFTTEVCFEGIPHPWVHMGPC